MKKHILIFLVSVFPTFAFTQPPRFGIDIGFSVNRAAYESNINYDRRIFGGFDGGFMLEFSLGKSIKLQPELNYTITGVELNDGSSEKTLKLQYASIPVFVKINLKDGWNLLLGAQHGILLSAWSDPSGLLATRIKEYFKFTDMVGVIGTEYIFRNRVFVGARYNHGFEQVVEEGMGFEMKSRYLTARIGYIFSPKTK